LARRRRRFGDHPRPRLSRDAADWAGLSVGERDVLLRLTVLFQAAEEGIPTLGAHAVAERLGQPHRVRLTCLRVGGKIIVQPPA
jgi:hypothetical protein